MIEEKPVLVSRANPLALFSLFVSGLLIVFTLYSLIFSRMPVWLGLVIILGWCFFIYSYSAWYSVSIYKDRLVVNYFFGLRRSTVQLSRITSWEEMRQWIRGGSYRKLILYSATEEIPVSSLIFSNYEELKSKLTLHLPLLDDKLEDEQDDKLYRANAKIHEANLHKLNVVLVFVAVSAEE